MSSSLQQAADAAGVNKSTVLRAIKAGKVSAIRDEYKQWVINPAELDKVYGTGRRRQR
jgi:predicted site-specific integrase-resolvase